ncbi:hypothetical protein [Streptomyces aureocirculatus]|uniref:hypothetical protein n=1 Tax=Streptomyces aureocirculatus TaxID=67275 RepID=UPI0014706705|nr:hypothetical protein [Streptomyces aureocirculatus]
MLGEAAFSGLADVDVTQLDRCPERCRSSLDKLWIGRDEAESVEGPGDLGSGSIASGACLSVVLLALPNVGDQKPMRLPVRHHRAEQLLNGIGDQLALLFSACSALGKNLRSAGQRHAAQCAKDGNDGPPHASP